MTSSRNLTRRLVVAVAAVATAGALAACSSSDDAATGDPSAGHDHPASASAHDHGNHGASGTPTSVAPDANSADVEFATMMIPHHQQAVDMANLVPTRTQNAWLIAFAAKVAAAQGPEIQQMETALAGWGQTVPTSTDHDMDGMMTPEQMTHLESLSGEAFDREWITMMIEHHRGAVTMAQAELKDGQNTEMRAMAQEIVNTQQAEIAEMEAQLNDE